MAYRFLKAFRMKSLKLKYMLICSRVPFAQAHGVCTCEARCCSMCLLSPQQQKYVFTYLALHIS